MKSVANLEHFPLKPTNLFKFVPNLDYNSLWPLRQILAADWSRLT